MHTQSLNGTWRLHQAKQKTSLPATVPGNVYTDLQNAGKIEDPFYRDNELDTFWIGETDWTYRRTFTVSKSLIAHDKIHLHCDGLDTLATLTINNKTIAQTDNMFRTYEWDIKDYLKKGRNTISITFASPMKYVQQREKNDRVLPAWGVGDHKRNGGGWIRKEPCNFGWDWGPMLVTCGIWRNIYLIAFNTARIADLHIQQDHSQHNVVTLNMAFAAQRCHKSNLTAQVQVTLNEKTVAQTTQTFATKATLLQLDIKNPKLWWPNGMGEQPLYDIHIELQDTQGNTLDTLHKRIGLRTLTLDTQDDRWGQSFQFVVNGIPFFSKGANWIPNHPFAATITRDDYAQRIQDAVDANMNMLRVWGGGIYEDDTFYDLCDEMGICIWQDFMFACSTYPGFDTNFRKNVKAEAEDNVRRIRHHACLALWCGNNELEQGLVRKTWTERAMSWADYSKIFDDLLPEVVQRLDPQTRYWPCSPHSPVGDREDFNNPNWGDAHLWSVWHGKQPFEWYRTCTHRFNSEFGFQSFPEPKTVATYTAPEDRNIASYVMEHHQRSGIGNATIMHYMLSWFRLPNTFENTLWLSQILQGMAIKYACEHWRRAMPRGMGTLYWQLNDCWPVASWSSVDSFGRWKALNYMARKFFAPVLISGVEDIDKGTIDIHITSDQLKATQGTFHWTLTDLSGNILIQNEQNVKIPARKNKRVSNLNLKTHIDMHGARNLLLWLNLQIDEQTVSTNLVTFARPKHLELRQPNIRTTIKTNKDGAYTVTLKTKKPALWTWLELSETDAKYSDNFVHLLPNHPVTITVTPTQKITAKQMNDQLVVRSLIDTY